MSRNDYDPNAPRKTPHDGGFSPDHEPAASEPLAPRKSRRWLWILMSVFGLGTLGLLICCGVGSLYFSQISSSLLEPARAELNQLTQIRQECGNIEGLSMNFAGTLKEAEINPDFVILDARCESGPRQFSVKMNPNGSIEEALLIREDGTRKELNFDLRTVPVETPASQQSPTAMEAERFSVPRSVDKDTKALDKNTKALDPTELELRKLESELELD